MKIELRQSIYSRMAGYEDVNDAKRLAHDPTFRLIGSEKIWERGAALTSRLQSFETELLAQEENLAGLATMNRELLAKVESIDSPQRVMLDLDSTEIPVYGQQENSSYNGHFESTCYHLWFVKIKLRVVCQTLGVLRSSNSNYRGSQKSGSVKLTSRKCAQNPECQSRRSNPRTIRQQQSAAPQDGLGGDCVAVMQAAYPRHGYHLAALPRCRRWNSACRRVLG